MGVRNLESFLERESRHARYDVRIPQLVNVYRQETKNAVPVVVIDGMSCLRPLYGKLSWLNGGQYKEFYEIVEKFINNFTKLGCELVVYFDGPVQNIKLSVWRKRKLQSAEEASRIFDNLVMCYGTKDTESYARTSFLPNALGSMFLFILSQHSNCKIFKSLKECDEEIARYALNNKCFAILAQDTDYVIYRGAMYYLSMKNLDIDTMTTVVYDGYSLAKELGFHSDSLPLFASLMGNDIIEYESLRGFHNSLRKPGRQINLVLSIAKFIKSLKQIDISDIAVRVFGTIESADLLRKSIQSYDLSKPPEALKMLPSLNSKWDEILKLALKKYIESVSTAPLYDILFNHKLFSSSCLEDYRLENTVIPVGHLLKELRRFQYGILLAEEPREKDKPCVVEELVMTGFDSMSGFVEVQPRYLEKVSHPGLKELWMSKDKLIQDKKWEILGEIFRLEPKEIERLPPRLIIPTLAARYVIDQCSDIADWEIYAYIACSVCVKSYEAQNLAKLPSDPLDQYKPVWLFTALSRTCATIANIFYMIGDPVCVKDIQPYQFTDGKLFHLKYRQCKEKVKIEYLCENMVENIECFELLKSIIYK